ncbi:MAG: hypothetical protein LLG00_03990 [Planctomycetaceae bacterium]|nr:hypothetical protein [Planctomycetaceae bacterium]
MEPVCERIDVAVYEVPTDSPESDGTYAWGSTTVVLVEIRAGGVTGIGYTYADTSTAALIRDKLAQVVEGRSAFAVSGAWVAMCEAVRNLGSAGIASMAISAVDIALWDLKSRLLGLPLATLLGRVRDGIPVYGSGGFTSYSNKQLRDQLTGWVEAGIPCVKMKIGREPDKDVARVRAAREAIGPKVELFVDANGAYDRKQAMAMSHALADLDVCWFEEPVSSDDLPGLRLLRDRAPAKMEIAAGEYGYDAFYFRRMLEAEAVDVLQADATRCRGVTGFLQAAALSDAFSIPLSAHTAPAIHRQVACATLRTRNIEYFHDHVRIERMFFDGADPPRNGVLCVDLSRPGLGLELKRADAEAYRVE